MGTDETRGPVGNWSGTESVTWWVYQANALLRVRWPFPYTYLLSLLITTAAKCAWQLIIYIVCLPQSHNFACINLYRGWKVLVKVIVAPSIRSHQVCPMNNKDLMKLCISLALDSIDAVEYTVKLTRVSDRFLITILHTCMRMPHEPCAEIPFGRCMRFNTLSICFVVWETVGVDFLYIIFSAGLIYSSVKIIT